MAIYLVLAALPVPLPFPFFNWALFIGTPKNIVLYDIVVTSTEPGRKLAKPIFLNQLSPELHRDWQPSPYKAIQRLGWLSDQDMWSHPLPAADSHMRRYFTEGLAPTPEHIQQARGLVDNYLQALPYVEYSLVRQRFDAGNYPAGGQLASETIASYKKMTPSQ